MHDEYNKHIYYHEIICDCGKLNIIDENESHDYSEEIYNRVKEIFNEIIKNPKNL